LCVEKTALIMNKKNLIEKDREKLTVHENTLHILSSQKIHFSIANTVPSSH